MADFKQIEQARLVLCLPDEATLDEIRKAYRRLASRHHPDKCPPERKKEGEERFKKINQANDILMGYCAGYRFSFREPEVKRNSVDREYSRHMKRFFDGDWF